MIRLHLVFSSIVAVDTLVAGLPAAARAVRGAAAADGRVSEVAITVLDAKGEPAQFTRAEIARLAPTLAVRWFHCDEGQFADGETPLDGERCAAGDIANAALPSSFAAIRDAKSERSQAHDLAALRRAGHAIITATGKPSDGLVSRYINRPISRSLSRAVLRIPGVAPIHGTMAALIIGIAMAGFLFFGGPSGVVIGAMLFQAASVIDGVDGEIARATHRSSQAGARLDTLCDAATNLAFIAGLTFNLWQQGEGRTALAGVIGLSLLATGLLLLGWRSKAQGGALTFDAVKNEFRGEPSRAKNTLAAITSRDVYALAFALMAAVGFAGEALIVFACAVAIWLAVIIRVLATTSPQQT